MSRVRKVRVWGNDRFGNGRDGKSPGEISPELKISRWEVSSWEMSGWVMSNYRRKFSVKQFYDWQENQVRKPSICDQIWFWWLLVILHWYLYTYKYIFNTHLHFFFFWLIGVWKMLSSVFSWLLCWIKIYWLSSFNLLWLFWLESLWKHLYSYNIKWNKHTNKFRMKYIYF